MQRQIKEIDESEFTSLVMNSKGISLVDFGAPWCPPCKALIPTLLHIDEQYGSRIRVYSVNVDDSPGLAARYDVRGLPTVILFLDGKIVDKIYGKQSLETYLGIIEGRLSNA